MFVSHEEESFSGSNDTSFVTFINKTRLPKVIETMLKSIAADILKNFFISGTKINL